MSIKNNYKVNNTFSILNESDLHNKVVKYIKKRFPHALIVPTLGELQSTLNKRVKAKYMGYEPGSPDIIILNPSCNSVYKGFAIEFKTPNGKGQLSKEQMKILESYEDRAQFKTLVSNDYDEILEELLTYFNDK